MSLLLAAGCGSNSNHARSDGAVPERARASDPLVSACESGAARSCLVVAEASENGGDYGQAARYYAKACDLGEASGCLFSGGALLEIDGRAADAARMLEKACDKGQPAGCYGAGLVYAGVYGPDLSDDERAASLFNRACSGNVAPACGQLGMMMVIGDARGGQQQGVKLIARGCDGGDADSCFTLASMFARAGRGERADSLVDRACTLDPERCQWFRSNVEHDSVDTSDDTDDTL